MRSISYLNTDGYTRRLKISEDGDWITLVEVQKEPNRHGYKTPHRTVTRLSITRGELEQIHWFTRKAVPNV